MSTTLTSMAILKVNFDRAGRDVLDNFIPFLADRAYHLRPEVISVPDLRDAVSGEYGISIPGGVVKTLSKRCVKRGLFRREAGVLYPERDALEKYDLSATRSEVRRQHAALVRLGVAYANRKFGEILSEEEFDKGLDSFIRENAAPLLAAVVEGHPIAELAGKSAERIRYLVGSFVSELAESEPEGFEYFTSVVKGALLASALYFPDGTVFSTRLDGLFVYADTTLLLRAVGASGPDLQLYAREVIDLSLKLGARVYCFKHTLDEIFGVLDACQAAVRRGGRSSYGEATEYILSAGWGPSDVLELKDQFEARLESIGVRVREKPDHDRPLTLDEDRLKSVLGEEVRYRNTAALNRDIDSLTAIYRLRRGNEFRHLERCKAIFVTHNTALARASRKFMKLEEWERDTIPLAVPDFVLTTLLWLKEPLAAPNLPAYSIIADCFAAMRPDDRLWKRYIEKIETLREQGNVEEDEYVLLRQSMPVRSLIMFETKEDPEAFTEGTVDRVLVKARENIAGAAIAEAASERQRRTESDVQLELAREEARRLKLERDAEVQRSQLQLRMAARRAARVFTIVSSLIIGCAAAAGVVLVTPWPGIHSPSLSGFSASVGLLVIAVATLLSLYGILFGGSLSTLAWRFERFFADQFFRLFLSAPAESLPLNESEALRQANDLNSHGSSSSATEDGELPLSQRKSLEQSTSGDPSDAVS